MNAGVAYPLMQSTYASSSATRVGTKILSDAFDTLEQTRIECDLRSECEAFDSDGFIYTCISDHVLYACTNPLSIGTPHYIRSSKITLLENTAYTFRMDMIKYSGCDVCKPGFYPEPVDTSTCNRLPDERCYTPCMPTAAADCTACGDIQCVGLNKNAAELCEVCDDNWFPPPSMLNRTYNEDVACRTYCDEQASTMISTQYPVWWCNGRGFCTEDGQGCICADRNSDGSFSDNGYFGPHCENSCSSSQAIEEQCSGHGSCKYRPGTSDLRCACDSNWFGTTCNLTAHRDDQHLWTFTNESQTEVHGTKCAGWEAIATSYYYMEYGGKNYYVNSQVCGNRDSETGHHECRVLWRDIRPHERNHGRPVPEFQRVLRRV